MKYRVGDRQTQRLCLRLRGRTELETDRVRDRETKKDRQTGLGLR